MNKQEILIHLKDSLKIKRLKLPTYMDFSIQNRDLLVHVGYNTGKKRFSCLANMQDDEAAFEGWSICLKKHLEDYIDNVILSWSTPNQTSKTEERHYNRFLYRVIQFQEMYSWFTLSDQNKNEIRCFENDAIGLTINNPINNASQVSFNKVNEKSIEYNVQNHNFLKKHFNLKHINHQLPVGVKKLNKSFFTGRASAIDLWGIDDSKNLFLFELKYNNKKVGIISELLFYYEVMYDVLITNKIGKPKGKVFLRDTEFIYGFKAMEISSIKPYFLADKLHPLVFDAIQLLNENTRGASFGYLNYDLKINETAIRNIKNYKGERQNEFM